MKHKKLPNILFAPLPPLAAFMLELSQAVSESAVGERVDGGGDGGKENITFDEEERLYVRPQTTTKLEVSEGVELLQDGTVRINVWASPRSLSTALMYSFAQVCTAVD